MKSAISLVLATTLAGALSGCGVSYEERAAYRQPAYYPTEQRAAYRSDSAYYPAPYAPERTYYSRDYYYRHYNGIDG